MDLKSNFEVAGGSVTGRDHKSTNKNCHDSYHWQFSNGILVAAVSDGCGSGKHSEVGAKLGCRLVVDQIVRHMASSPAGSDGVRTALQRVRRSVLSKIGDLADAMPGSYSENIGEFFLFTVVGAIITTEEAFTFACGDGAIIVNGEVIDLSDNGKSPDYLSYGLIATEGDYKAELQTVTYHSLGAVESIVLATDGVRDLIDAAGSKIPGKEESVGEVSQFWKEDRFFKNPFWITNRLNLINREHRSIDWAKKVENPEFGHLRDDTTLVVIRRRSMKP